MIRQCVNGLTTIVVVKVVGLFFDGQKSNVRRNPNLEESNSLLFLQNESELLTTFPLPL